MGSERLHVILLIYYFTHILHPVGAAPTSTRRVENVRRVCETYRATDAFFRAAFEHECGMEDCAESVLATLYEGWRRRDSVEAGLCWAEWLLNNGQARRATEVIESTPGSPERWAIILDTR